MSGSDTSRGINFQYACAIGIILDFPSNPSWQIIQLEGSEDIEDVQVFDANDEVLLRAQIKQKEDPYQWQPHEVRDILLDFSKCPDSGNTRYKFIYAGSVGPAFVRELHPILTKLRYEGSTELAASEREILAGYFGEEVTAFALGIGPRLDLQKRETWQSIQAADLRRIRNMATGYHSKLITDHFEQSIYDELFRVIAEKSESSVKYFRRLTREDVYRLLQIEETPAFGVSFDADQYFGWIKASAQRWAPLIPLDVQRETVFPDILSLVLPIEQDTEVADKARSPFSGRAALSLFDVVNRLGQLVLVGEPGTGKTVSLWQLALLQSKDEVMASKAIQLGGRMPVYVEMASYSGESLIELIIRAVQSSGQRISIETVEDLAMKGQLLLLFDDFDLSRTGYLSSFLPQLKSWRIAHRNCHIVVATHRTPDGRSLGLPTFRLRALARDQARQLLMLLPGLTEADAMSILYSLPQDSQHLVASPLTLRMLAYVYVRSNHRIPKSRGSLYQEFVDGILALSESKGLIELEKSDKLMLLTLLARWMQNNEVYSLTPTQISGLVNEWIESDNDGSSLAHLRSSDRLRIRSEILYCGLLRNTPESNAEFIHSTFRSYLAALSITNEELPALVEKDSWLPSLILWASVREKQMTDALLDLLAEKPILLGQVVRERAEKRLISSSRPVEIQPYFDRLNGFFNRFIKQFPLLLQDPPWSALISSGVTMLVARSSSGGYTLHWQKSNNSTESAQWSTCAEILRLAKSGSQGLPLTVWLLPEDIIHKYHPLEIVYLWTMRSLFDLLAFIGWQGGIDAMTFGKDPSSHPAIALIINRFLLYQDVASRLHPEIRDLLPFYAHKEYDLAIEVHEYSDPPVIRYAVAPGLKTGQICIVQSVLRQPNDPLMVFKQANDGSWYFEIEGIPRKVLSVEEVSMGQLIAEPQGSWAQKQLKDHLEQHLAFFPPRVW